MRFMMMIKSDETTEAGAMPDERIIAAMQKYNEDMARAGALLAAEGLQPSSRGARVTFHGGKPTVTDGPFAEAKELIAGYWLIQAPSLAAAVEWAKRAPIGTPENSPSDQVVQIEVRQLFEAEDFPGSEQEPAWFQDEVAFRAQHPVSAPAEPGRKQFMLLRMADRYTEQGVMPGAELLAAMGAYNLEMVKAGVMLAGEGLRPSSQGARVNFARGKRTVVDGPFTESKELIAGFSLIQARTKEEAIDWVKRWPAIDSGGEFEIRIREVFSAEDFGAALTPELREAEERLRSQIAGKQ